MQLMAVLVVVIDVALKRVASAFITFIMFDKSNNVYGMNDHNVLWGAVMDTKRVKNRQLWQQLQSLVIYFMI